MMLICSENKDSSIRVIFHLRDLNANFLGTIFFIKATQEDESTFVYNKKHKTSLGAQIYVTVIETENQVTMQYEFYGDKTPLIL